MKGVVSSLNNSSSVREIAEDRNQKNTIYCSECCTAFKKQDNGDWVSKKGRTPKVASLVRGVMLKCTCGETIGFVAPAIILPGEAFGMDRA